MPFFRLLLTDIPIKRRASEHIANNNDANQNIITAPSRKKHVITDLMCRISFITIHENVWLDFSSRYCHLLCLLVFVRQAWHILTLYWNASENPTVTIPDTCDFRNEIARSLSLSVFFSFCLFVALLRFGDMRSDILWFFWFWLGLAWLVCTRQIEEKKRKHRERKRTIISPHTWVKRQGKTKWQSKSIASDE